MICARRYGGGICGAVVELTTDSGRLVEWCRACERFRRGICLECPRPVAGPKSRRCTDHAALVHRAHVAVYVARHRETVNRRAKVRMRRTARAARRAA